MKTEVNGIPVGTFNEFRESLGIPEGAGSPPLVTVFYNAYLGAAREQIAGDQGLEDLHDGPNTPTSRVSNHAGTMALINIVEKAA